MDFNDINDQKGYYILDFKSDDIKYKFYKNEVSPVHIKVTLSNLEKLKEIASKKGWSNLAVKIVIDKDIKSNLLDKIISSINFEAPFSLTTDYLNQFMLGGFPLGFWFAQQGAIYIFVILIFVYVFLMNRLDKKYKVDEL